MVDRAKRTDDFEQIQSDLYGVALTQEQLQDAYTAGTSDGLVDRRTGQTSSVMDNSEAASEEGTEQQSSL